MSPFYGTPNMIGYTCVRLVFDLVFEYPDEKGR